MKRLSILFAIILITSSLYSQIYQFRGPNRDGFFPDTGLLDVWPESGPELILEIDGLGAGYSSPIITENRIYITGKKDSTDYLSAIDFNGTMMWQVPYGHSWAKSFPETRCSPTIEDNRIYVLSGMGELACFNTSGEMIWTINVDKDYEAEWHSWGVSESILIVDDKVICTPGGNKTSVVAFDKITGELLWQTRKYRRTAFLCISDYL